MNGKQKCKILKKIRHQIAQENDIAYITSECKHQGDCSGTCPKCEAEVRYLEEELKKRRDAGKAVAVAGVAAALMLTATGCQSAFPPHATTAGDVPYPQVQTDPSTEATTAPTETLPELMGEPAIEMEPAGALPPPSEELVLQGDVVYVEP